MHALITFVSGLSPCARMQLADDMPEILLIPEVACMIPLALFEEAEPDDPPLPESPTMVTPSPEKAGVLARRLDAGEGLWHPGDLRQADVPRGIGQKTHRLRNGASVAGEWECYDWEEREMEEAREWSLDDELDYWRREVKPVHFPETVLVRRAAA